MAETTVLHPLSKKNRRSQNTAFGRSIKEVSISLYFGPKITDIFHPSSLIYNCEVFLFFNWTDTNVWHMALFSTPFQNTSFAAVFSEFRCNPPQVHPHLQWRVRFFFTHLNEIHFDVTFERITSAWGSREEVSCLHCYWLKLTTAHLSFSDGR